MAQHLGEDVAAYVDGQLSPEATARADEHLADCQRCRQAVAQQRTLKARMGGTGLPAPPPDLLASLGAVPTAPIRHHYSFVPAAIGTVLVLIGASMAVIATAYTVAPTKREGDAVRPQFDQFASLATSISRPNRHLSSAAMNELDQSGWPSRENLGVGFVRIDGHMHEDREVVAQTYMGNGECLTLFEQVGTIDNAALTSFTRRAVADRPVWVREGHPRIITWDADGMIYTVVTEIPDGRLEGLLKDLPAPPPEPSPMERVGAGLVRMSGWL